MENRDKFRIAVRKYDPFESAIEKIWKAFCAESGCQLELDAVPMDLHPLYDAILKDGGLKKGDWDVAHMNTDWISEAYGLGALESLTPYLNSLPPADYPDGWSESLTKRQKFGEDIIGIPFHDGPECLIYRKDLFESEIEKKAFKEKYNRQLTIPETWDELVEVAEFFYRPEDELYGTTFAAYPDGHNTVFDFCLQLWTRGGELLTPDCNINVNSSEAAEGMKFYRKVLQNPKAIHPKSREFDSVNAGMAFANGNLAMMVNWFGFASMCEVLPESKVKGNVDVANVPAGSTGKGVSLNAYWMYTIGSGSTKKDIAYDFIRFAVRPENDKLVTLEGGIGCRKSTWYDEDVNREVPYYHKLNELHQNAKILPRMTNWAKIADVIDQLVIGVMNTTTDIQEILDIAQSKIDRIQKG